VWEGGDDCRSYFAFDSHLDGDVDTGRYQQAGGYVKGASCSLALHASADGCQEVAIQGLVFLRNCAIGGRGQF